MAKATALLMSSVTGAFNSRPFFIVNLNRIRLYFSMFSLAYSRSETENPELFPQPGFLLFIYLYGRDILLFHSGLHCRH
ncbi:hypothetical protein, partial [Escherichia coli]|uniref:hypothetical protein n=3 Tax=Escherichia coli TaxID=562 RepID=UPI001FCD874D